jgi:hypothetical protein
VVPPCRALPSAQMALAVVSAQIKMTAHEKPIDRMINF